MIEQLFPRTQDNITNLKCFTPADVRHYFDILFKGEKKHGRFMFLEHLDDGRVKITFVRFIN